ncbi:MAG: GNAT family N-acetyltransferase [Chthoniobacterales bacterium]
MKSRTYQDRDLLGVATLYTASIHEIAAAYYTPVQITAWAPVPPDLERWRARMAALYTIVAEVDGVLAGFASYTLTGYLDLLFTQPDFARRGVATGLYLEVEAILRRGKIAHISTHASLAARPFFDRAGFECDAEELVECRGAHLRRFAMSKKLGERGG